MRFVQRPLSAAVFALGLVAGASAWSADSREQCEREFAPRSGQAGKDVIWVPTRDELVTAMLDAAKVTSGDYVIDLGSGDGRIPIAAASRFGARALGIEYNPEMVKLAQCQVRAAGVSDKVQIRQADIFQTDFSDATVLTLYLLSDLNMRLRPTILKMRPGTRVVSNSFDMGDWPADEDIDLTDSPSRGYLWIVPAQVQGTWSFREEGGAHRFQVRIEQKFQNIEAATASGASAKASVRNARLRGADIEFTLNDSRRPLSFKGKVDRDKIRVSTQRGGKSVSYVGQRV